jgi:hypothetical protein
MKTIVLLMMCIIAHFTLAQSVQKPVIGQYLSVQTGGLFENQYNSGGIRTFFEFQKDFSRHKQWAISYEHSTHFMDLATDHSNEIESNISALSCNYNYKIFLWKDKIFWTAGLGAGALHMNWDNNNKVGLIFNASLTLNLKITERIFIETAPLLVLFPFNRFYYSPIDIDIYKNMYAYTVVPIGIKIRL